ncbi:MAG: class I SAM-dependent methyltransferase [Thermofilum sp.]
MSGTVPAVPFVPSPPELIRYVLKLANLQPGELLLEPGCGDGRTLVIAAKEFKARAVGIEIRKDLFELAMKNVTTAGVDDKVLLIHGSFYEVKFPPADVVFLYLLTSVNEKLRPKLFMELKPTTRIVSHDFEIVGWKPVKVETFYEGGRSHKIYYYVVGESARGLV